MLAAVLVSAAEGRLYQPVIGGIKPQIVLRSTTNTLILKLADETDEGIAGYNCSHSTGLRILLALSDCSVACSGVPGANTRCSPAGG